MEDFIRIDLYNFYYAEGRIKHNKNILYVEIGFTKVRITFSISSLTYTIHLSNVITDGERRNLKYYNNV